MKKTILFLLFSGITLAIFSQIPAKTIPDFKFFRRNIQPLTNRELPSGKMTFFFFFDPGCDHCQHAMTEFNKKYKTFNTVTVCLVSVDSWQNIDHFIKTYGPAVSSQKNVILLRDSLNQFITKFQPRRYPAMFLYATDKKIMDYEDTPEALFRFERLIGAGKSTISK